MVGRSGLLEKYLAMPFCLGLKQFLRAIINTDFIRRRRGKQIWAIFGHEAVANARLYKSLGSPIVQNRFNWSIFSVPSATIYRPFFYVNQINDSNIEKQVSETPINLDSKTKDVCWIISNCRFDGSRRLEFAIDFISNFSGPVHLWGVGIQCLNSSVGQKLKYHGKLPSHYKDHYDIPQSEIRDCKFYLALENSICENYITEKFVNALKAEAIPIVNGWRESYDEKLPGSFVHVSDFPSVSDLARHVEYLLKNKTALLAYHQWRKTKRIDYVGKESLCSMCRKLTETDKQQLILPHFQPSIINNPLTNFERLQKCA